MKVYVVITEIRCGWKYEGDRSAHRILGVYSSLADAKSRRNEEVNNLKSGDVKTLEWYDDDDITVTNDTYDHDDLDITIGCDCPSWDYYEIDITIHEQELITND